MHDSACHRKTCRRNRTKREQAERTDCAATQSDLLGLGDGRHLSLGPLVDALVDGVDESQEGALLLMLMLTLVVECMIGLGAARWCGQNGEGSDRRRSDRTRQEGLLRCGCGQHIMGKCEVKIRGRNKGGAELARDSGRCQSVYVLMDL